MRVAILFLILLIPYLGHGRWLPITRLLISALILNPFRRRW